MITLYSGTLGSGKSYKMVAELSRLKDSYFVIHNIDNLKEGYLGKFGLDWVKYCQDEEIEIDVFFSKDYQLKFSKTVFEKYKRPILVIIDEAHEWFDRHVKAFKMWLSYSRHLDQDIWLVAHNSTNIPAVYRSFVGVEYRAKSGAFVALPYYFFYNRIIGGQRGGYTFERKSQKIFDLYKSKEINNEKKTKVSLMLPAMIVLAMLGIVLFFWLPSKAMTRNKPKTESKNIQNQNPVVQNQNSSVRPALADPAAESFENKYAFVGVIDKMVVLENRKTGVQAPLSRIIGKWVLVESDRDNSVVLFNGKVLSTLYNSERFVHSSRQSPLAMNQSYLGAGMEAERRQSAAPMPVAETTTN